VMGEAKVRAFLEHRPSIVARVLTTAGDGRTRVWESKGFDRLTKYR
jgi:hypothetical protein